MSESIPIPVDLLAETQAALDAALSMEREAFGPSGRLAQVRAKLTSVLNEKAVEPQGKSDTIQRRSELKKVKDEMLTLARRLEKLEKAA